MGISITLSDIQVRRSGRTILEVEQLTIPAGSFTALLGPNGAGKTTLLKVCGGLLRPNRGTVQLDARVIPRYGLRRAGPYRNPIGYIPQQTEYNAHLPFTVREVAAMGLPGRLWGRQTREDRNHIDRWLEELGLAEKSRQTFRSLSGGQQQKVLIARAMSAQPRLLLLDEPGTNLDTYWKKQLREILERLHQTYLMTVLLITHDWEIIPNRCNQVIVLERGQILYSGNPQRILQSTENRFQNEKDSRTLESQ